MPLPLLALGALAVKYGPSIAKGIKGVVKGNKLIKKAVIGTGLVGGGIAVNKLASGGQGGLPALPGNLPALQNAAIQQQGAGGLPVPFFKGAGGKLQMPWNDPRIPEYLKQFALDDAYLRIYYRAPRGYVIVRDANGRAFAVNKKIAQQFGIWKPSAKPPISATEYKHYKRNQAIEKKLRKIAAPALRKAHGRATVKATSKRK